MYNFSSERPPVSEGAKGALRVGNSRVLLELVLRAFLDGATPENIVQRYSTLQLADVYAVIGYYLKHRQVFDLYLQEREKTAEETEVKIETSQPDLAEIRRRLLAERAA
jgi:uncharacterized protein (DUF433 family)